MAGDTGFGKYPIAVRMLRIVRRIAAQVIEEERPRVRYGIVESVNFNTRTAMVKYPGEPDAVKLPYGMIGPSGAGEKVRVDGPRNDRYISDVLTGSPIDFEYTTNPPP